MLITLSTFHKLQDLNSERNSPHFNKATAHPEHCYFNTGSIHGASKIKRCEAGAPNHVHPPQSPPFNRIQPTQPLSLSLSLLSTPVETHTVDMQYWKHSEADEARDTDELQCTVCHVSKLNNISTSVPKRRGNPAEKNQSCKYCLLVPARLVS